MPKSALEQQQGEKCHRAKILKYAIEYIQTIKQENEDLHSRLSSNMPPSPIASPLLEGASSPAYF